MGQTNKQGLRFTETTNTAATRPKTMFVKASVASDVTTTFQTVSATTVVKTVNTRFLVKIQPHHCLVVRKSLFLSVIFAIDLVTFNQNALNIKIPLK